MSPCLLNKDPKGTATSAGICITPRLDAHLNISGCYFHLIDRQQTSWQSQKPRAPRGRQSGEIYECEDEGCGTEGGENPPLEPSSSPGDAERRREATARHPHSPSPFKPQQLWYTTSSPSDPSLQMWHCGSFAGRLWSNQCSFARGVTITNS